MTCASINRPQVSVAIELHDVYESEQATGLAAAYSDPTPDAPLRYLATIKRIHPPGTHFSYSGANTYILGKVVTAATGKRLGDYLAEKIWRPMGMEDDAYWRLDSYGQEVAQGGLSATLRDMGRFGLVALHDGLVAGKRIVPDGWFAQASATDGPPHLRPGAIKGFEPMGYGYQWWTLPDSPSSKPAGVGKRFAAIGIYGQQIYVVPEKEMVVVIQSATPGPVPMAEVLRAQVVVDALANIP